MRRLAAILLLSLGLFVVGAALPSLIDGAGAQTQETEEDLSEESPGLGRIIGSPEAGPKPTDAGDRGGVAQLALAAILLGGVGFIGFRISRAISH